VAQLKINLLAPIKLVRKAAETTWFWAILLVTAVVYNYWNTLHIPFLLDDFATIENNNTLKHLFNVRGLILPINGLKLAWRPISNITFAISYNLSGLNPSGYHIVNIAIHATSALAVYGLLRITFAIAQRAEELYYPPSLIAGTIALLWATHPLLTQTVNYISQRTESLMALFYITTLYCFIRGTQKNTLFWNCLSIITCIMGTMTKEVMATIPFIIVLYDRTFISLSFRDSFKKRWWLYLSLAVSSWIPLGVLLLHIRNQAVGYGLGVGITKYIFTESKAVVEYIGLCIWPKSLIFDRGAIFIDSFKEAVPYGLILTGILSFCTWCLFKVPALGFICSWFFIILAPTSSFIPVTEEPMAENRLYLPLITIVTLFVLLVWRYCSKKSAILIFVITLICTISATKNRNLYYKSGIALWEDTISKAPKNARAHNNLGLMLEASGNQQRAITEYEAALKLYPTFVEANNNLAIILAQIPERRLDAITHYETALKIRPDYAEVQYKLSLVLAMFENRKSEAIQHCKIAIDLNPNYSQMHNTYAALIAKLPNQQEEAIRHFEEAIKLRPDFPEAHSNLTNLLSSMPHMMNRAVEEFKTAILYNPKSAQLHYNFGVLLSNSPNYIDESIKQYTESLKLNPDYIEAHTSLGYILSHIPSKKNEAISHFKVALKLNPNLAIAHFNLAVLLEDTQANKDEIRVHLNTAIRLAPDLTQAKEALKRLNSIPPK
jgi:tetratricopeptide (TPR) repeat protein